MNSVLNPKLKRIKSNQTGYGNHPGHISRIKNAPPQPSQFKKDSFHERQSKKRGPVVSGQGVF